MSARHSLRLSTIEAPFAEIVGACASGAVLTAWALALGLSPAMFGLLGALPYAAQLVQMPAAWVSRSYGARKTAIIAISASRQVVLPLACLPFLPLRLETRQAVFLTVAFAGAALGIVGNNAWTTWMSELVPARIRGRYFGRRSAICALAATCSALGAGLWLDGGPRGAELRLAGLSLVASAAGLVTSILLFRQGGASAAVPLAPSLRDIAAPLRSEAARRFLQFQVAWSFASGLAAAFYPLHMIGNLGMGFAGLAVYNAGLAAARMVTAPLFGRALDRVGAKPVIACCTIALCISPVVWMFPTADRLWPLALDALLCGTAMGGYNLAVFSLPASISAKDERAFFFAAVATAGGLATAVASAAGGGLVKFLPANSRFLGLPLMAANVLFLLGGAARAIAVGFAFRIVEPGARPVVELGRLAIARVRPSRAKLAA